MLFSSRSHKRLNPKKELTEREREEGRERGREGGRREGIKEGGWTLASGSRAEASVDSLPVLCSSGLLLVPNSDGLYELLLPQGSISKPIST